MGRSAFIPNIEDNGPNREMKRFGGQNSRIIFGKEIFANYPQK
jgi:hypothetical protein